MSNNLWIIRRLVSDVLARRREYNWKSLAACIARSTRVLAYIPEHKKLLELDVVRNYLADERNKNLFHHLSQRAYLIEGLSVRQRIQCLLAHYQFEDRTFTSAYKRMLYLDSGMTLWKHHANGLNFSITLTVSPRWAPEGELSICCLVEATPLHCLSFNWIDGHMVGLIQAVVPFIGRNQGTSMGARQALAAFNEVFPNNSPSFFCFAAMQGIAGVIGSRRVIGIKGSFNICFDHESANSFANSYDKFWKSLGGVEMPGTGFGISLPFYGKPLSEIAGKHRKRAAMRRSFWESISHSARDTLQPHVLVTERIRLAA